MYERTLHQITSARSTSFQRQRSKPEGLRGAALNRGGTGNYRQLAAARVVKLGPRLLGPLLPGSPGAPGLSSTVQADCRLRASVVFGGADVRDVIGPGWSVW